MALGRVLVAARGEEACRVVRACRDEHIEPVVVATTADANAGFITSHRTATAPEGIVLEDLAPADIVRLALDTGCAGVHPGFGGLALNAEVAAAVEANRLAWAGPSADLVATLADRSGAAALASDFGIPVAAPPAPSDGRPGRYVAVPVFADPDGAVVHFAEQWCTVSAAGFALIAESPAMHLDRRLRTRLAAAAVLLTKCLGYVGGGSVRFVIHGDHDFAFVSMTPCLPAGHAMAEALTGIDLVRLQLTIAAGEASRLTQDLVRPRGHVTAAQVHIGGPRSSPVTAYREPSGPGIRVESAVAAGTNPGSPRVPSLRLIVSAPERPTAVLRLQHALNSLVIGGARTDLEHLRDAAHSEAFSRCEPTADAGGPSLVAWLRRGPASLREPLTGAAGATPAATARVAAAR